MQSLMLVSGSWPAPPDRDLVFRLQVVDSLFLKDAFYSHVFAVCTHATRSELFTALLPDPDEKLLPALFLHWFGSFFR